MNNTIEYPEVTAGIAWLDETDPGWAERMDLSKLSLGSISDCVICQVAGIQNYNLACLFKGLGRAEVDCDRSRALGFNAPTRFYVYGKKDSAAKIAKTELARVEWWKNAETQWRRAIIERINRKDVR